MQRISPLRSSIEAFNKFKASRAEKANKIKENATQTNPFGITFKGKLVAADVFTSSKKTEEQANVNPFKEKMESTSKLLASAWAGTINKFSSIKTNAIAFGNKLKDNTIAFAKKVQEIGNTEVKFENPFKYTVGNLQKQSVGDLRTMLTAELQGA